MFKKYTPEEFWKLYEKLPEDLQDALFSEEVATDTRNICERNEIKDIEKFVDLIGHTLLGLLPPDDFDKALMEELNLDAKTAKKVAIETERFIFYHVKKGLTNLYRVGVSSLPDKPETPSPSEIPETPEKKSGPQKEDTYREPIDTN